MKDSHHSSLSWFFKNQAPLPQPGPGPEPEPQSKRKKTIPVAFREQIWIRDCGRVFEAKCTVTWCQNRMTVFDFQSGHNVPESKGGATIPSNLAPICARCNMSMGDRYTITQWSALSPVPPATLPLTWCCTA